MSASRQVPPSTIQWLQRGRTAEVLGQPLFVIDEGDPALPVVVLLHGFPSSSWDWARVWERLRQTHRLVAFDFLGFGFSAKPRPHAYSIHEQADLSEALVHSLSLDRFHVLAHDYGDTVAQELLARQNAGTGAGHWQSLCLLNGGLFPETHRPLLVQRLLLSRLGPLVNRVLNRRAFERAFRRIFGPETQPSPAELEAYWGLILHNDGLPIFHRLIRYMRDRVEHRERWVAALREASLPIALINGSSDPISGAHMVARYRELLGDPSLLVELPTIGHYPQVEAPEDVAAAYLSFLGPVVCSGR